MTHSLGNTVREYAGSQEPCSLHLGESLGLAVRLSPAPAFIFSLKNKEIRRLWEQATRHYGNLNILLHVTYFSFFLASIRMSKSNKCLSVGQLLLEKVLILVTHLSSRLCRYLQGWLSNKNQVPNSKSLGPKCFRGLLASGRESMSILCILLSSPVELWPAASNQTHWFVFSKCMNIHMQWHKDHKWLRLRSLVGYKHDFRF